MSIPNLNLVNCPSPLTTSVPSRKIDEARRGSLTKWRTLSYSPINKCSTATVTCNDSLLASHSRRHFLSAIRSAVHRTSSAYYNGTVAATRRGGSVHLPVDNKCALTNIAMRTPQFHPTDRTMVLSWRTDSFVVSVSSCVFASRYIFSSSDLNLIGRKFYRLEKKTYKT